jgi:hypothetical protein
MWNIWSGLRWAGAPDDNDGSRLLAGAHFELLDLPSIALSYLP